MAAGTAGSSAGVGGVPSAGTGNAAGTVASGAAGEAAGASGASAGAAGGTQAGAAGAGSGPGGGSPGGSGGAAAKAGSSGSGGASPWTPPTDCGSAHGYTGCCSPDSTKNYWYSEGKVSVDTCAPDKICTWLPNTGYYACASGAKPSVDPSGVYPITCGAPAPAGACTGGGGKGGGGSGGKGGGAAQGGSGGAAPVVCGGTPCALPVDLPVCCTDFGTCGLELSPGTCTPTP